MYTVAVIGAEPLQAELSEQLTESEVFVLPFAELLAGTVELDAVIWLVDTHEPVPAFPEAPLLALVGSLEDATYALRYGAVGVLTLETDIERLLAALSALTQGLVVLEPMFLPTQTGLDTPPDRGLEPLTPRESDVLTLLAEGSTNKAIAKALGISDQTVKFHLNALLGKLGATSRTEAVTKAVRAGLLTL